VGFKHPRRNQGAPISKIFSSNNQWNGKGKTLLSMFMKITVFTETFSIPDQTVNPASYPKQTRRASRISAL
jgi:hypothetical protein